ncbi:PadR family transcriptional regulator [Paenibacillus marinisediminis]
MSLRYGILGFLSKWEATGYDLKKEFDDFMGIFWHSHLSQIYPELNKLEQEQLISSRLVTQSGKPDKKIYTITEAGLEELMKWLITPPEAPKIKDSFLMQTVFMDNVPIDEVIFQIKTYQKERELRLMHINHILQDRWQSLKERDVASSRILMGSVVLKRGIDQEIQYIRWCEETIQFIESCSSLWDKDARLSEVEDAFLAYFGDVALDYK